MIMCSGGRPPCTAALGYDSSRIFRWIMPIKSAERIRDMVGTTLVMTDR